MDLYNEFRNESDYDVRATDIGLDNFLSDLQDKGFPITGSSLLASMVSIIEAFVKTTGDDTNTAPMLLKFFLISHSKLGFYVRYLQGLRSPPLSSRRRLTAYDYETLLRMLNEGMDVLNVLSDHNDAISRLDVDEIPVDVLLKIAMVAPKKLVKALYLKYLAAAYRLAKQMNIDEDALTRPRVPSPRRTTPRPISLTVDTNLTPQRLNFDDM